MIPKIEVNFGKCFICGKQCNQHNFLCDYCDSKVKKAYKNFIYFDKYDITNRFYSIIDILNYTELFKTNEDKANAIFTLVSLAVEQYNDYHDLYLITKLHLISELINEPIINYVLQQKEISDKNKNNSNNFNLMQDIINYNNNLCNENMTDNFRKNNPNDYICNDGHNVRSLSELVIDNFFYDNNIKHVYEKSIYTPDKQIFTTDFYLPQYNIYIEYWGLLNNYEYKRKREKKLECYKQLDMQVIEIFSDHLKSLGDYLLPQINKINKTF